MADRALSIVQVNTHQESLLTHVGVPSLVGASGESAAAQRAEIQGNKADLEDILGLPVIGFSHPHGSPTTCTAEAVAATREAGLACVCSNFAGVVWRGTGRFQLPRVLARDWDGDEFARRLREWFRG